MSIYLTLKTLHLLSAIFFIGCVYMRTLVIPRIESTIGKEAYTKTNRAIEVASRDFGRINNTILAITGVGLFSYHLSGATFGVYIKVALGSIGVLLFFTAPFFAHKAEARFPGFKKKFHFALFGLMVSIVVCVVWVFG